MPGLALPPTRPSEHDFLTPLAVAGRRHDVVCIRVCDVRETEVPPAGLFELEDAETGQRRLVNLTPALAKSLAFNSLQRTAALQKDLAKEKADLIDIPAGQSPVRPLMAFFERRARRR